jgi:hypothetical protein
MGLFDIGNMSDEQKQALQMGLFTFGTNMMQNSVGQNPTLVGSLGNSLPAGLDGYQKTLDSAKLQKANQETDPLKFNQQLSQINSPEVQNALLKAKLENRTKDIPTKIREFNAFYQMTPEQQQKYIELENAGLQNQAGSSTIANYNFRNGLPPDEQQRFDVMRGYDKPLPASIIKEQNDYTDKLNNSNQIVADAEALNKQLTRKEFSADPLSRAGYWLRNKTGFDNNESKASNTFDATMNSLRNKLLLDAKGTQTEGDAKRAVDELLNNIGSDSAAQRRLQEIMINAQRNGDNYLNIVNQINSEYKRDAYTPRQQPAAVISSLRNSKKAPQGGNTDGFSIRRLD